VKIYTPLTVQNAESAQSMLIFMVVTQNHSDGQKSRHTTKITVNQGDREYMIILQTY